MTGVPVRLKGRRIPSRKRRRTAGATMWNGMSCLPGSPNSLMHLQWNGKIAIVCLKSGKRW